MSIVATEIESVHGAAPGQRLVYYRCQDHLGEWHRYGPVITVGTEFDAEAHKAVVAAKIEEYLAEREAEEMVR